MLRKTICFPENTVCIKKTYPQTLNAFFQLNIGQILQIFISNESAGQDLSGYVFSFSIKYLFKKISGKKTLSYLVKSLMIN